MTESSWNDVGERFSQLGRTLQDRWSEGAGSRAEEEADEVRGAFDGVRASLDDLADTITRTVNDEAVHESAKSAAGGLIAALGSSLDQLADKIQTRRDPD